MKGKCKYDNSSKQPAVNFLLPAVYWLLAILFFAGCRSTVNENKKQEIALVTNKIHKLFTLPGGGVEGKDMEDEIKRECAEEIGQKIEITGYLGAIHEFRDRDAKEYQTTCFTAKALTKIKKDLRTKEEVANGLKVVWVDQKKIKRIFSLQEKKIACGKINFYNTAFNIIRDGIFINKWLNIKK
jgi:ADP-ribose pyrophosphatase YjhB (NUDIX family)